MILLTSTLSPTSSVCSIDDDGMKKGWTTKDLMTRAMAIATTMRIGSSRHADRDRALAAWPLVDPAGPGSPGPGSPGPDPPAPGPSGPCPSGPDPPGLGGTGPEPRGAVSGSSMPRGCAGAANVSPVAEWYPSVAGPAYAPRKPDEPAAPSTPLVRSGDPAEPGVKPC